MSVKDHLSENIEEYLEVIYKISLEEKKPVTTSKISKNLQIAPGSVTQMLKKLDEKGYVHYSPYKGVVLSKKGIKRASNVTRKHRLIERFLNDILKIKKEKIHKQACKMEHTLSDEAERALCQLLEQPDHCPDNDFIPACNFKFKTCEECLERKNEDLEEVGCRDENLVSISSLNENEKGRVSFIRGDYKVVRRLMDMGITIGAMVSVLKIAPFKGPVELGVRGSKLALGRDIAKNIFVEIVESEKTQQKGAAAHV